MLVSLELIGEYCIQFFCFVAIILAWLLAFRQIETIFAYHSLSVFSLRFYLLSVCANGDTANKIGTYNLSIISAFHNVPFYVAAPITSLDVTLQSGDEIPIEERPAEELVDTSKAPKGCPCWNPAFDVTPAKNIAGIITEKGVIEPDAEGKFDVKAFV